MRENSPLPITIRPTEFRLVPLPPSPFPPKLIKGHTTNRPTRALRRPPQQDPKDAIDYYSLRFCWFANLESEAPSLVSSVLASPAALFGVCVTTQAQLHSFLLVRKVTTQKSPKHTRATTRRHSLLRRWPQINREVDSRSDLTFKFSDESLYLYL